MQKGSPLDAVEDSNTKAREAWQEEVFGGDTDFAEATLEGMAAFAEGQETIMLEELKSELA